MQEAVASLKKARDRLGGWGNMSVGGRSGEIGPDAFIGLNIMEASEKFLRIVGRPARPTQEIVEGLLKGGLRRVSQDSVVTILLRSHNGEGKVVRVQKGLWGLEDWYPKRPPKLKRSKGGEEEEVEGAKTEENGDD